MSIPFEEISFDSNTGFWVVSKEYQDELFDED